jgi:hypothetical protein
MRYQWTTDSGSAIMSGKRDKRNSEKPESAAALATTAADNSGATRRNKAFQLVRRDLEIRLRNKKKSEENGEVADDGFRDLKNGPREAPVYADRHREGAVGDGIVDIKKELKVRQRVIHSVFVSDKRIRAVYTRVFCIRCPVRDGANA